MSYTLVKAVVLGRTIGSQWKEVDVSIVPVVVLFNTYYKVYLELSHVSLTENIYVDLDIFRQHYSSYSGFVADMLNVIGDATLETVNGLPNTDIKYVKFSDAFRSEYKVDLTVIDQVLPDNYPTSLKDDLVITRPRYDTDMSLLHTHALITVNGYVHETITHDNKTYVYDGGKTMRKARNNALGILSFLDVSEVHKKHLTEDMIFNNAINGQLYDRTYIDTGIDLNNKSYFMVVGGYLVFPEDNVLWRTNDHTIALNLNQLPYIERFYESDIVLDQSHLAIERDASNPGTFNINQLKSNEFIRSYLKGRNTFLVTLDVNHLSYNKIYLRHSNLPGMFTAYQDPTYPLIVNYGRVAEYWKTYEDKQWSVTVHDSFLRNFVIDHYSQNAMEVVNVHLVPMTPNRHSRGFLLEIGGYNI